MVIDWRPCPLSSSLLQRYRYRAGHQSCPAMAGGHLMRRKGAGMEFHEYTAYMPGDDIRRVDWEASARSGKDDAWLVRRFVAEEQTTLLISVDLRSSMCMPRDMSKGLVALWLAEALALVGLQGGDRVALHQLFDQAHKGTTRVQAPLLLQSPDRHRLHACLRRMSEYDGATDRFNALPLQTYLPPASIWVVITDLYFDWNREVERMARTMCEAQTGLRWLVLVDLDTWSCERVHLGNGERRLEGPSGQNLDVDEPERLYLIDETQLDGVAATIDRHKRRFHGMTARSGRDLTRWVWPDETADPEAFFRDQFLNDVLLHRIFMRGH